MSNSPAKIQTVGEASSSISSTFKSTFSSLANTLGLPELRDSFFQNIIYILLTIIILVGILVYIQMVGPDGNDPLNLPPSRVIKKVEIKKIVEGFDISENSTNSVADNTEDVSEFYENNNHDDIHLAHSDETNSKHKKRY
jgi:hypothetical protein